VAKIVTIIGGTPAMVGTLEQVANRIGDRMIPDLPALVDQPQRSAPKPAGDPRAIAP
jgi:hypothetical protein